MHFAYPARKDSNPPPFRPRTSRTSWLVPSRRNRLRTVVLALLGLAGLVYLFGGFTRKADPYHEHVPSGTPPVVIVTVVDPMQYSNAYLETVEQNRRLYAERHGYETFIVKAHDYDTGGYQQSWSKVMAMRHAITTYPDCQYIWFLDQDAFIIEPGWSLDRLVLDSRVLEGLMIKDYPVVPPDSIIRTYSHLGGDDAHLVISQDKDGLVTDSIVIRNGDWAKFLLETWLDPLYRSYNFEKAERHAMVGSSVFLFHNPGLFLSLSRDHIDESHAAYANLLLSRNTWSSGIRPSCPRWPSSRSAKWRRTCTRRWATGSSRAISWPCSRGARPRARGAASPLPGGTGTSSRRGCRPSRPGSPEAVTSPRAGETMAHYEEWDKTGWS